MWHFVSSFSLLLLLLACIFILCGKTTVILRSGSNSALDMGLLPSSLLLHGYPTFYGLIVSPYIILLFLGW
jgi:hypothetical protein